MRTVWLITNPASGSVGTNTADAIEIAVARAGADLAGRTEFPADALPDPSDLGRVDTVIVAAGDGTINATARALEGWPGRLLALPGGTMNVLPKLLHGDADNDTILAREKGADATSLPVVEAAGNVALVGAIIGPAAIWVHAREAVRKGRWHRLRRAVTLAWTRTFGHSVRIVEDGRRSRGYRAIYLAAEGDMLRVVKVTARGWRDGVSIGWHWLKGDIVAADGVEEVRVDHVTLASSRPTFALFDGEPAHLPVGATIRAGHTRLEFVTTAQ